MSEPTVIINGKSLTEAQAMTLRVAMTDFQSRMSEPAALGSDEVGEDIRRGYQESSSEVLRIMLTPPPQTHVAPSDTVTVDQHMKDFEAFVAATAPKLHWKVYQDLGADPTLSKGYYDGWQHGFGEEVIGPLPIPQLMEVMKHAVRKKVAALATTEGSADA